MLSLLTTLLLAGSALAAPTANANTNKCTSRSTKVKEWTVHDFDFHSSEVFTTPAHQNSWGYVNFTLSNPVVRGREPLAWLVDALDRPAARRKGQL